MSDPHIGDIVQIGRGYQRWTVIGDNGATVTVRSDPGRQAVASSGSARIREVDRTRVSILDRKGPS